MFHKDNRSECFTPGFICVLHTFGRDFKWNPHIHCLLSESGIGNSGRWRSKTHFNYRFLRDAFQTALLNELQAKLGSDFKKVRASIYGNHKNGFYVHAKPNKCNPKIVTKYIGRYLGRPVIATSLDFIERLIRHIPEKHFKQIRYYGIYTRHLDNDKKLNRAISKEKQKIFLSFNRWRDCILLSFGYDPLKCPCCGATMEFMELYHNHHRVSLDELYKKTMAKALGCRSPDPV